MDMVAGSSISSGRRCTTLCCLLYLVLWVVYLRVRLVYHLHLFGKEVRPGPLCLSQTSPFFGNYALKNIIFIADINLT
jgi:hypothetical protein